MTIKRLLVLLVTTTLLLAGTVTVTAILLYRTAEEVESAQDRRYSSYLLAEELLRSSEMLTRFSRTYVVTGESRYREYYDLILEIRNGKIKRPDNYGPAYWTMVADSLLPSPARIPGGVSLDERMQDAGITVKEFALLRDGQVRSDNLVNTEDQAMDLVSDLVAQGNPEWKTHPAHIKALELLHGRDYHR
ncbi:MAG: methyl-accepting chemotaxis protein, partial [Bacteroidota bacterium]